MLLLRTEAQNKGVFVTQLVILTHSVFVLGFTSQDRSCDMQLLCSLHRNIVY
jgi:hypothetical protein